MKIWSAFFGESKASSVDQPPAISNNSQRDETVMSTTSSRMPMIAAPISTSGVDFDVRPSPLAESLPRYLTKLEDDCFISLRGKKYISQLKHNELPNDSEAASQWLRAVSNDLGDKVEKKEFKENEAAQIRKYLQDFLRQCPSAVMLSQEKEEVIDETIKAPELFRPPS